MGYLEANRFGYAISGSHSSRTAEGDNAVLMNKVASELVQKLAKDKQGIAKMAGTVKAKNILGPLNRINIVGAIQNRKLDFLRDLMFEYYEYQMTTLLLEMKSHEEHGRVSAWMEYCQV